MKEIWKNIPGYENSYQISNKGHVKSSIKWNGSSKRILQPATKKDGHLHVCLYKNRISKTHMIHRLVMLAFVGPLPTKKECRHLNGDPKNNELENLQYGTHQENMRDCSKHNGFPDRRGVNNVKAKLTPDQVTIIRKLYNHNSLLSNKDKLSQLQIANLFKMSEYAVWAIINRKTWKHLPK